MRNVYRLPRTIPITLKFVFLYIAQGSLQLNLPSSEVPAAVINTMTEFDFEKKRVYLA